MEENFTMYDIADRLGWKYIQKSKGYIKCPFCGTEKLACNITDKYFSCLKCGTQGNFYKIYADLYGIHDSDNLKRTQIAARELRKLFGSDFQSNNVVLAIQNSKEDVPRRDKNELDDIYCGLVQNTSLSKLHKEALLNRGLTEKQIEAYGFRSVDNARSGDICRILQSKGLTLKNTPGFYYDTFNGEWRINTFGMDGYFIICPDENGLLQGFQIRLDTPKNGQKYLWLSSNNKLDGASSGSPSAYFGSLKAQKLVVVDGILKALVCNCFSKDNNTAFMGVAGVNNYKNMREMLERLAKRGVKQVFNAYDMDEFTNPICDEDNKHCSNCKHKGDLIKCQCEHKLKKIKNLKAGSKHLEDTARELGLEYSRITWDKTGDFWNGQIKGLDDYLVYLKSKK